MGLHIEEAASDGSGALRARGEAEDLRTCGVGGEEFGVGLEAIAGVEDGDELFDIGLAPAGISIISIEAIDVIEGGGNAAAAMGKRVVAHTGQAGCIA